MLKMKEIIWKGAIHVLNLWFITKSGSIPRKQSLQVFTSTNNTKEKSKNNNNGKKKEYISI